MPYNLEILCTISTQLHWISHVDIRNTSPANQNQSGANEVLRSFYMTKAYSKSLWLFFHSYILILSAKLC